MSREEIHEAFENDPPLRCEECGAGGFLAMWVKGPWVPESPRVCDSCFWDDKPLQNP